MIFVKKGLRQAVSTCGIIAPVPLVIQICHDTIYKLHGYSMALTSLTDGDPHAVGTGGYHPWGMAWDWQCAEVENVAGGPKVARLEYSYFKPDDMEVWVVDSIVRTLRETLPVEVDIVVEKNHFHGEIEIKKKFT